MSSTPQKTAIEDLYRQESRRVFATLLRLLGDFQLAEEALQEAFIAALKQWPSDGVPANPRAWLVSAGRFKAIDALRRQSRFIKGLDDIADSIEATTPDYAGLADDEIGDDRLRLIFTCCHPALSEDSRVALTLREVCGLTTEEIASAFLCKPSTIAQRIVRAKAKIRAAHIPYQVPGAKELHGRLNGVLQVLYLLYNEGYSALAGDSLGRMDLAVEAMRLTELLLQLQPHAETMGLLALMLLQESRRDARCSEDGELILLPDQDRSLWKQDDIRRGASLVRGALLRGPVGVYTIQAAIAAVHAESPNAAATDWAEIVGLYDVLMGLSPSPIIALNRAVALGMRDGPAVGLLHVDRILRSGELHSYHLLHAARADFLRQLGERDAALAAYK
tara:strand:+ start:2923 stop:4095 length:1173 start_codon:yes stop_codon:yes gene_type:complete